MTLHSDLNIDFDLVLHTMIQHSSIGHSQYMSTEEGRVLVEFGDFDDER